MKCVYLRKRKRTIDSKWIKQIFFLWIFFKLQIHLTAANQTAETWNQNHFHFVNSVLRGEEKEENILYKIFFCSDINQTESNIIIFNITSTEYGNSEM